MFPKNIPFLSVLSFLFGLAISLQTHSVLAEMKIYGNGIDFPQTPELAKLASSGLTFKKTDSRTIYYISSEGQSFAAATCNAFAELAYFMEEKGKARRNKEKNALEMMVAGFAIRVSDETSNDIEQQTNAVLENSSLKSIYEIYKGQAYLVCETIIDMVEKTDSTGLTTGEAKEKTAIYQNTTSDGQTINLMLPSTGQECDYSVKEYGYQPEYQLFFTVHEFNCRN